MEVRFRDFFSAFLVPFLFLLTDIYCDDLIEERVPLIKELPVLDGDLDDSCWSELVPISYTTRKGQEIIVYAGHNYKNFYLALKIPSINKETQHLPWVWDPQKKVYVSGDKQEFTISVIWAPYNPDKSIPEMLDAWFWRSCRTNKAGYADDFAYVPKEPEKQAMTNWELSQDDGLKCWYSKYFSSFAGDEIPRFYSLKPTRSCADVKAFGKWENGYWTIELERKLNTGHEDDIEFKLGVPYTFYLSYSVPEKNPVVTENDKLKFIFEQK